MTAAVANPFNPETDRNRANWLGRLLKVDKDLERDLRKALRQSSLEINNRFAVAKDWETKTGRVDRTRLALAHSEIRKEVKSLFGKTECIIANRKSDAAVEAVNARLYDQKGLLAKFLGTKDRERYGNSLRASAGRNIESVEARLVQSKIPLSKQVWKTHALAQGHVDSVINSGLAQGKSARAIAAEVRHMVSPSSPGGISYAAMRLGRSEIGNAFHAQSIWDAQQDPWIDYMEWHLSAIHAVPDDCTAMNGRKYPSDLVPDLPHPNCRCFVVPVVPKWEELEKQFHAGMYDRYLDSVLAGDTDYVGPVVVKPKPIPLEDRPIESAKDVSELTDILKAKYPKVEFSNWVNNFDELKDAIDVGKGIEFAFTKTPILQDTIKSIAVEDFNKLSYPSNALASCGGRDHAGGVMWQIANGEMKRNESVIKLNSNYTNYSNGWNQSYKRCAEDGWFIKTDKPAGFYTVVHELGHAFDNTGYNPKITTVTMETRTQKRMLEVMSEIKALYRQREIASTGRVMPSSYNAAQNKKNIEKINKELGTKDKGKYGELNSYGEWVKENSPSKYSLDPNSWQFNQPELNAESYADYLINGNNANPLSKKVFEQLEFNSELENQ